MYTLRKNAEGQNVFILSPGTDYDGDGIISGELEERDPIGYVYDEDIPEIENAFTGKASFQYYPTEDQWGTTYSLYYPVYNPHGELDAVFGIDYNVFAVQRDLLPLRWMILALVLAVILVELFLYWFLYQSRRELLIQEQGKRKLEEMATTDHLTKIYNRNRFEDLFGRELERVRRYKRSLAMVMFDIDHYKQINDTQGHQIGDHVLVVLTRIVAASIRKSDIFARWGGDEFVLVFPEADRHAVVQAVGKIRKALAGHEFIAGMVVHCSYGGVVIAGTEGASNGYSMDQVLRLADEQLYQAKKSGRDCFVLDDEVIR
jgi:diguanylate cyclase (GGDEF)-like protein